ncbi:hypothetical protein [Sorangium sp. So ce131]|uniref:hypothetical protein n=1 Tax=Sorangium sp. So ce131 TaxID=3133282 RepID=UPI003F6011DE
MAHSDAGADKLKAQGVEVYRGDIRDPKCLVEGVRATDATIHLAFHIDFSDFPRIYQIDRDAISAMLDAMAGTNKAFVGTNGTLVVSRPGRVALETDESPASSPLAVRLQAERLVVDAAKRGVRGSVIRLAPTVHGAGDKGFIAMLINVAREKKTAGYLTRPRGAPGPVVKAFNKSSTMAPTAATVSGCRLSVRCCRVRPRPHRAYRPVRSPRCWTASRTVPSSATPSWSCTAGTSSPKGGGRRTRPRARTFSTR